MNKIIKENLYLLISHAGFFIFGTVIFILLFSTPVFAGIKVLFYRGIALLILSTLISSISFAFFKNNRQVNVLYRDIILSAILVFCINLVFFTHLPVTAERSVSVYILSIMNKSPDKYFTEQEISDIFINGYVKSHSEIQRRFNEQTVSGNIIKSEAGYRISGQGRSLMKLYSLISGMFNIDTKNLTP